MDPNQPNNRHRSASTPEHSLAASFGSVNSQSSHGEGSRSDTTGNKQRTKTNRSPPRYHGKLSPIRPHHQDGTGNIDSFFDDAAISSTAQSEPVQAKKKKSNNRKRSPNRRKRSKSPKNRAPADMTVICNRVSLYDCSSKKHHYDGGSDDDMPHHNHLPHPNLPVAPYHFAPDMAEWTQPHGEVAGAIPNPAKPSPQAVAVVRAPHHAIKQTQSQQFMPDTDAIDTSIPNPHPPDVVHDKYWAQRRRLFSRFDMGVQLDAEGWYSVTPEVIANHVAQRIGDLSHSSSLRRSSSFMAVGNSGATASSGIIVLDAFCGCGGNTIAFGKIPTDQISLVVCIDIDRTKLRKAAYNACLYEIPKEKLIFVECSSLFILEHCYHDGILCIDKLRQSGATNLPEMVETEVCAGFFIGGLGMLPPRIDAVFMDPPWGGVDYNSLGKNGYCLEKHMKIKVGTKADPPPEEKQSTVGDDFFDSFGGGGQTTAISVKQAKQKFNQKANEDEYWNGVDLLKVAASATKSRLVIYDMPRNTNKTSLGKCALAAGYRGNLKLEEHYLNGRLKTVTAYMGADYSSILRRDPPERYS